MFQHDLNHYPYSSISECSKIWHNLQRTKWKFQNKWYLVGESKTQSFYTLNSDRAGVFELQWNFHYHIWEIKSVHYGWFNNSILSSVLPYFLIEKTNQQLGTLQPRNSQKPTHTPQSEWKKKKGSLGHCCKQNFVYFPTLLASKVLPLLNLWCFLALFLWTFENLGILLHPEIIHQCHYMYSPSQIERSWLKIFKSYYYFSIPFAELAYWLACGLITL